VNQFTLHYLEKEPKRVDVFLSTFLPYSRSFIQKLFKQKLIKVNGNLVKPAFSLNQGDKIEVLPFKIQKLDAPPRPLPLDIIYQDKDIAVINKPPGMVVHPACGHIEDTMVNALKFYLSDLSYIGGVERPGILHRLDKDTSGIIVVAKNDSSHLFLSEQFRLRNVEKVYIAIVEGVANFKEKTVNVPIGRHSFQRTKMDTKLGGKPAITEFKLLRQFRRFALLRAKPRTGRTHQIRVHLKYLGFPVVGDSLYGKKENTIGLERLALHSYKISFAHPGTKKWVSFTAKLPVDLKNALKELLINETV